MDIRKSQVSTNRQIKLYHLSSMLIAGVLASLLVNVFSYYAPRVEGYWWPVAESHDTAVEVVSANKIRVTGIMSKFRDCDLVSSAAFVSDAAGNRVIAKVEPSSTIKLRPVEGPVEWGPWNIDVPVWFRKATLTISTVHQCHPLWVTQSTFVRAVID
jgi:hypothetical protein